MEITRAEEFTRSKVRNPTRFIDLLKHMRANPYIQP